MDELKALLPLLQNIAPRNVALNLKPYEVVRIVEGLATRWNYGDAEAGDTTSDILTVVHWFHQRERTRQICFALSVWIKRTIAEYEGRGVA
jgi:hypothetical protein